MAVATHHDGLGFHQAFIAQCTSAPGAGVVLSGKGQVAWGAFTVGEQVDAHGRQSDLDSDIGAAIADHTLCHQIQDAFAGFKAELPHLPQGPCLFVRERYEQAPSSPRVAVIRARPGDAWDDLLDAFCAFFKIPTGSPEAARMALGMAWLWLGKNALKVPKSVMLVTNIGFRYENGCEVRFVDPISVGAVDVLDDLGVILALAEGVGELDASERRYRKVVRRINKQILKLKRRD